ncbi:hypothetical protein QC763_0021730 [Podospora pseudopauciseta]|uniref:Uncharacterized protein n=1 Tax=Podospora pseudopauciseta TaxID=2093780 RepID=A0ABR0I257_9PEZI|nr:hypothetical protein QC763_0021730 [Podospora pseudopauciseta]
MKQFWRPMLVYQGVADQDNSGGGVARDILVAVNVVRESNRATSYNTGSQNTETDGQNCPVSVMLGTNTPHDKADGSQDSRHKKGPETVLGLTDAVVPAGKPQGELIGNGTSPVAANGRADDGTGVDGADKTGRPVVGSVGENRAGSSVQDLIPAEVDAVDETGPEDDGELVKGRKEINTAAAICQGNRLPEQAAETKQQESVTGTLDKCCSGDAGIRGDVGENRVLEGHRKSSAKGVDHNHGESQHLAASAPVERVLGIIARTGNKLDSVPHLCACRRRAGNIDEVDGAGHHGRMLNSHPEVCVEVDERALTGESQSSLGTRRNWLTIQGM